jgi:hypothetical protein
MPTRFPWIDWCGFKSALTKPAFVTIPVMRKSLWRAAIEVGFIIFLFYSNLLMGEFAHSGKGHQNGLFWAVGDVVTTANFMIAIIAALIGYVLFEFLRSKF